MILVTGSTGFPGEFIIRQLLAEGREVVCFARPTSDVALLKALRLPVRTGDVCDEESVAAALDGVQAVINVPNLTLGCAPPVLAACRRRGVERVLFLGSTSVFTRLQARSRPLREQAEAQIRASGLAWTILRPTMIYGTERDRNMCRLARALARWPVFPVVGSGRGLQQPVHVEDLASAVTAALDRPAAVGRAYDVSGREPLTFREVIETTAAALGQRARTLPVPLGPAVSALRLYERLAPRPRLRAEQLLRLEEDKAFSHAEAAADLDYAPRSFAEGIRQEVALLREKGLLPAPRGRGA